MFTKILVCSIVLAAVFADRTYEYTDLAKKCMEKIGVKEETIRHLVPEKDDIPTDDNTVLKFLGCCFDKFLNDKAELKTNDELRHYITDAFSIRMKDVKRKLVELVADDCIDHCKDVTAETKAIAAVKVMNCLKDRLYLYVDV